jgi:hypothetical protein
VGAADKIGVHLGEWRSDSPPGSHMGMPAKTDQPTAAPRARLDLFLDVVGVLLLGWALLLWRLGSAGDLMWPGGSEFSGEFGFRNGLTAVAVVLAVPLIAVVLATFGRAPSRSRLLAALPLLVGFAAVAGWRFIGGFVAGIPEGRTNAFIKDAGTWDGLAVSLGLAATALLVIREYRLSRRVVRIATVAAATSVTASLIVALVQFSLLFRGLSDRDEALVGLAVLFPPLLIALLGVAMAPIWLRQLWGGDLRAAAALVLWGVAVGAEALLPEYFRFFLGIGRNMLHLEGLGVQAEGLDWAEGLLAVAAAVLLAPLVRAYPTWNRRVRATVLAGPLTTLALLLIFRLVGALIEYLLLLSHRRLLLLGHPQVPTTNPAEQVIVLFGLIGAALMLVVAVRPRDRSGPLAMFAAVGLIVVPVALYLLPEAFHGDGYHLSRSSLGTVIQPLVGWDGNAIALVFVLPVLLLGFLLANRAGVRGLASAETDA